MLKLMLLVFSVWISCATLEKPDLTQMMKSKLFNRILNSKSVQTDEIADGNKVICEPTPLATLNEILGPAFNARYMAVERPFQDDAYVEKRKDKVIDPNEQRDARMIRHNKVSRNVEDFVVDPGYSRILDENILSREKNRDLLLSSNQLDTPVIHKERQDRSVDHNNEPWACESRIHWIDLGKDYFPRYLRSVECISKSCWYFRFKCKGRAFTVKVLKRRRDSCIFNADNETKMWFEDWVFEERAVNFCCECSMP